MNAPAVPPTLIARIILRSAHFTHHHALLPVTWGSTSAANQLLRFCRCPHGSIPSLSVCRFPPSRLSVRRCRRSTYSRSTVCSQNLVRLHYMMFRSKLQALFMFLLPRSFCSALRPACRSYPALLLPSAALRSHGSRL